MILLLDESGLLMAPLVRRSWAPRGHPPLIKQKARHREKVSVAAAIRLAPRQARLGAAYLTLINGYFTNEDLADFLRAGLEGPDSPLIVVWIAGARTRAIRSAPCWPGPRGGGISSRCRRMPRN